MPILSRGLAPIAVLALVALAGHAFAQDVETGPRTAAAAPQSTTAPGATAPAATVPGVGNAARNRDVLPPRLPRASTTEHTLELPGRTLRFKATAGALPITGTGDKIEAEIAFISYQLVGSGDAARRPVAFVFNGGPGSSSAWLHVGAVGPWRLPMQGAAVSPSAPPDLVPNAETWLDFTDLVLIDPVGTGYSHLVRNTPEPPAASPAAAAAAAPRSGSPASAANRPRFWTVGGDIDSLGEFIRRWTAFAGRQTSPRMLVGESYGGFRVPRLARQLQTVEGLGVGALVIISPVLDFGAFGRRRDVPMANVAVLPSLAAAAIEAKGGTPAPAEMRPIEAYARGEFLADLMRGPRDKAAVDRIVARVATLTGLAEPVVRQYGGRLDGIMYRREANRPNGEVASAYDASMKGLDQDATALFTRFDDPFSTALQAPVTSAVLDLYAHRLSWRVPRRYEMLNMAVNRQWRWGNSTAAPESVTALRAALALDRRMVALVAHGYTDVVTPYFGSELLLSQFPDYAPSGRLRQMTYPGGHMFYARDASRQRFRADVERLLKDALAPPASSASPTAASPPTAAPAGKP